MTIEISDSEDCIDVICTVKYSQSCFSNCCIFMWQLAVLLFYNTQIMQLCRKCKYLYPSETRIPCLSCDSTRLTIPVTENLVGIVERLLDRGVEVVSANCDVIETYDEKTDKTGKTVILQIELGFFYPDEMFEDLPPDWMTYKFHTVDNNSTGPKFTGLSHSERFFYDADDDEVEFATLLTVKNLEAWLDDLDADAYRCVWMLAGYISPFSFN